METGLIRTDKPMYKLKRFFMRLFFKNNYDVPEKAETIIAPEELEKNIDRVILNKTETQEKEVKEGLANKIKQKEMNITILSDDELEEMIEYFKEELKEKKKEFTLLKDTYLSLKGEIVRREEELTKDVEE